MFTKIFCSFQFAINVKRPPKKIRLDITMYWKGSEQERTHRLWVTLELLQDSAEHFLRPENLNEWVYYQEQWKRKSFFTGRRRAVNDTKVNTKHLHVSVKPVASETAFEIKNKIIFFKWAAVYFSFDPLEIKIVYTVFTKM